MLKIEMHTEDPIDMELIRKYWEQQYPNKFTYAVKDLLPHKNINGTNKLPSYISRISKTYIEDYCCSGCNDPIFFISRSDYLSSCQSVKRSNWKDRVCNTCQNNYSQYMGYPNYKIGFIDQATLLILERYIIEESEARSLATCDFSSLDDDVKLILLSIREVFGSKFFRESTSNKIKSIRPEQLFYTYGLNHNPNVTSSQKGMRYIIDRLIQEKVITDYPLHSDQGTYQILLDESNAIYATHEEYDVAYSFAANSSSNSIDSILDSFLKEAKKLKKNIDSEINLQNLWEIQLESDAIIHLSRKLNFYFDFLTSPKKYFKDLFGYVIDVLPEIGLRNMISVIDLSFDGTRDDLHCYGAEPEKHNYLLKKFECTFYEILNAALDMELLPSTDTSDKKMTSLSRMFYKLYSIEERSIYKIDQKNLLNDIVIPYNNDQNIFQLKLSNDAYGQNIMIEINGRALTVIYFDTVAISADFIDGCERKNNQAYLSFSFYKKEVTDQVSELTFLINKESSSELRLVDALSSSSLVSKQDFITSELIGFLNS